MESQPEKKRSINGRNARGQFAGQPGPGRRRGVPNKATTAAREACAAIVDSPAYRRNLFERATAGKLAPAVEAMLWHYAHGKPKEHVDLEVNLYQRLEQVIGQARQRWQDDQARQAALTGEVAAEPR